MSLVAGFINNITMKSGTTVSSGELTQWAGSSYTYTVPAGETGPAVGGNTLNGVDVARFSGDVMSFADAGYDRGQDFRIQHFVIKGFDNGSDNYVEDAESGINRSSTLHDPGNWRIRNGADAKTIATMSGNWEILTIVRRKTAGTYDAYIGSTKVADAISDSAAFGSAGTGSVLGSRQDFALNGQFDLAQMVFYAGASMPLTEQQILDNISFLDSEWLSSTFTNTTPADGATGVSPTTQFDWADPDNHNNYNLRISETDFGTAVRDIFTTSKTHTLSSALDALTQYFWKVRTYTPGGPVNVLLYNQQFTASDAWTDFNTQILSGNGSHVVESGKGIQRVNASTIAVADLQTTQISDVEITVELDASDVSTDIQPTIHFRTQGAWLSNDQIEGYWVWLFGDTLQLGRTKADGGTTTYSGESLTYTRTNDTKLAVKILLEGFRIRAKIYDPSSAFPGYDGGIDFTDSNQRFSGGGFSLKTASNSSATSNSEVRYDSLVFDEGVQLTNSVDSVSVTPSSDNLEPNSEISVLGDIKVSGSFTGSGTWTKESGVAGITIKSTSGNNAVFQSDGTIGSGDTNAVFRLTSDEDATKWAETTITPVDAVVVSGSRANDESALVDLANTLNYQTWDTNTGWDGASMSLSDTIHGVTTSTVGGELRVTKIDLFKNGIDATNGLPVLDNLTEMEYFNVMFNTIAGPLPRFNLPKCKYLYLNHSFNGSTEFNRVVENGFDLHDMAEGTAGGTRDVHPGKNDKGAKNKFTGELYVNCPLIQYVACAWSELSDVNDVLWTSGTSLRAFWLDNAGMTNREKNIPSALGNHANMSHIGIAGPKINKNKMWGNFPPEISNLTLLYSLRFGNNFMSGTMPDLSNCDDLQTIIINFNNFTDGWPIYLIDADRAGGVVGRLVAFAASWTGGNWTDSVMPNRFPGSIRSINIPEANLSGTIPQLPNQTILFDGQYNNFTSVVEDFTNLTKIRNLVMNNNPNLSGELPEMNWLKPSTMKDFTRCGFGSTSLNSPGPVEDGREYDNNQSDKGDSGPIVQKTRIDWYRHHCIASNNNKPFNSGVFKFSAP